MIKLFKMKSDTGSEYEFIAHRDEDDGSTRWWLISTTSDALKKVDITTNKPEVTFISPPYVNYCLQFEMNGKEWWSTKIVSMSEIKIHERVGV